MGAQEYIDKIAQGRGFVLDFHKVMAKHDYDVLVATDDLVRGTVLADRELDKNTKELLFILCLVAVRGSRDDLETHIRIALGMGITSQEILEALEILIPLAGVALFKEGFEVWREVTGAEGLEPSAEDVVEG
ncbi:carboxymuconolactone decarboxylase family protein [Haloactinomyces albus]|uniref:4-carboxymuconolactone decarboxylase n=1 Tax=Haloactinomyces albus TaxID=1352928 RepID=A0AAE3ZDR2_9ACTN|nr:carboxymuconolactone decarboxylase family protein [Haloactinomyces albus]MDR7301970.1 4-carboxymuconolactone decarboxylase [Haloactinomyces albus]